MDPNKAFFTNDAWAKESGIDLIDVSTGRAKLRMKIEKRHMNGHGTVHGGVIFTLADTAFALASNSHGIPAAAINAHISYVKSATAGTLSAECAETSLSPKLRTLLLLPITAGKKLPFLKAWYTGKLRGSNRTTGHFF